MYAGAFFIVHGLESLTSDSTAFEPASVWTLAWPSIVANLCHALVNLSHIKIIGALGTAAVAAVTTNQRFFFFLMALLMGLSTATTATVARSWGARQPAAAASYTWNAVWIAVLLTAAISLVVFAFPQLLVTPFHLEPQAAAYAAILIRWISAFNVVFAVGIILTTAMRATGDVISPMIYTAILTAANGALVYAFTYGKIGLPRLDIYGMPAGIGLAAIIVNGALIYWWMSGRLSLASRQHAGFSREKARELLNIGLPAALEQGLVQGGFLIFLALVAGFGTAPYAAYGIGVSLLTVSIVVGFGFSIAGATLVGQYIGAKQPHMARKSGWHATGLAVATMTGIAVLIAFWAEPIARFFVDDDEVVAHTVLFIYILAAVHPLIGIELTLAGALRGAGDTRFPLFSSLCGLIFGRIGLAWLFISLDLSVVWVYCSLVGEYSIKASLIVWRYHSGAWLK